MGGRLMNRISLPSLISRRGRDSMEKEEALQQRIDSYIRIFQEMMERYGTEIPSSGILAGFHLPVYDRKSYEAFYGADNTHYPMGKDILLYGIGTVLTMTEPKEGEPEERSIYREGVHRTYGLVQEFIARHAKAAEDMAVQAAGAEKERLEKIAEICRRLTQDAPQTFAEALQLFWFLYLLRSPFGGGCIGRLDQRLYPFYEKEEKAGVLNRQAILEEIVQFYEKLNKMTTGDTLRNLMLSGQNENGMDETNELTYLFLEAYKRSGKAEPHLNVRIHPDTPEKLLDMCVGILGEGKGQPTLYFDDYIIPAMERAGIPHREAVNYANDGCTETLIDGTSNIVFWQHEMVKTVELTVFNGEENPFVHPVKMRKNSRYAPEFTPHTGLKTGYRSGELEKMQCFDDFLEAFLRQQRYQVGEWIKQIDEQISKDETESLTSLLIAGMFKECLETGNDPLRQGGFSTRVYQLLSGTVTTAADCLRAIEYGVFEKKYCTLTELRKAMEADFEGYEILRQRLVYAPKFGNDEGRAEELAAVISQAFIEQVNAYQSRSGQRIWPGLYNIDFRIFANLTGATPDGRRFGDMIGEHCSPTPGAAKEGPTAVIRSAAKLPMEEGYASSPLHLTLDKGSFVMGADREKILRQMIKAAEKAHIPVLNIAMYEEAELREAQKEPEKHGDLIVRVWGFNARFVDLDENLQEHIIRRITRGT